MVSATEVQLSSVFPKQRLSEQLLSDSWRGPAAAMTTWNNALGEPASLPTPRRHGRCVQSIGPRKHLHSKRRTRRQGSASNQQLCARCQQQRKSRSQRCKPHEKQRFSHCSKTRANCGSSRPHKLSQRFVQFPRKQTLFRLLRSHQINLLLSAT